MIVSTLQVKALLFLDWLLACCLTGFKSSVDSINSSDDSFFWFFWGLFLLSSHCTCTLFGFSHCTSSKYASQFAQSCLFWCCSVWISRLRSSRCDFLSVRRLFWAIYQSSGFSLVFTTKGLTLTDFAFCLIRFRLMLSAEQTSLNCLQVRQHCHRSWRFCFYLSINFGFHYLNQKFLTHLYFFLRLLWFCQLFLFLFCPTRIFEEIL